MSIYNQLRIQRLNSRKATNTQQMVIFRLRQEWFMLPIQQMVQVIPAPIHNQADDGSTARWITYRDRQLPVIDVNRWIFGHTETHPTSQKTTGSSSPSTIETAGPRLEKLQAETALLLIFSSTTGRWLALPINSPPILRRVDKSSLDALPEKYLTEQSLQYIGYQGLCETGQPPIFQLEGDRLWKAWQSATGDELLTEASMVANLAAASPAFSDGDDNEPLDLDDLDWDPAILELSDLSATTDESDERPLSTMDSSAVASPESSHVIDTEETVETTESAVKDTLDTPNLEDVDWDAEILDFSDLANIFDND